MRAQSQLLFAILALVSCGRPSPADTGTVDVGPSCITPKVVAECEAGWCRVPAGCFVIGSPSTEWARGRYSENQVQVTITRAFQIQQREFTRGEWVDLGLQIPKRAVDGGIARCSEPACPIDNLTWFEALAAANAMSRKHGLPECYVLAGCLGGVGEEMTCASAVTAEPSVQACPGYRLLTEAEWEAAARAGTPSATYAGDLTPLADPFACALDPVLDKIAWYCANSENSLHPGGGKAANGWGLHDMLGNAAEWVNDVFDGLGYGKGPLRDPGAKVVAEGSHVFRGGVFNSWSSVVRAADRAYGSGLGYGLGMRLARTL